MKESFGSLTFEGVKNNFLDVVKNRFFCFAGTAARKEFWQYIPVLAIVYAIIAAIIGVVCRILLPATITVIVLQALLVLFWLSILGVTARRLHDVGKSGLLQLLFLIPSLASNILVHIGISGIGWLLWLLHVISVVGVIVVLILCIGKSRGCGCGCGGERK